MIYLYPFNCFITYIFNNLAYKSYSYTSEVNVSTGNPHLTTAQQFINTRFKIILIKLEFNT